MALGYVLDEIFIDHRAPSGHPERPARAEAVPDYVFVRAFFLLFFFAIVSSRFGSPSG